MEIEEPECENRVSCYNKQEVEGLAEVLQQSVPDNLGAYVQRRANTMLHDLTPCCAYVAVRVMDAFSQVYGFASRSARSGAVMLGSKAPC